MQCLVCGTRLSRNPKAPPMTKHGLNEELLDSSARKEENDLEVNDDPRSSRHIMMSDGVITDAIRLLSSSIRWSMVMPEGASLTMVSVMKRQRESFSR